MGWDWRDKRDGTWMLVGSPRGGIVLYNIRRQQLQHFRMMSDQVYLAHRIIIQFFSVDENTQRGYPCHRLVSFILSHIRSTFSS